MATPDAVIIGSGPNGLVAANVLAGAGWDVLVLEAQDSVGGAVRSDCDVHTGYVHDTFSSFYPLGVASPAMQAMELERHGVVWSHAPAVVGTPFPGGGWVLLHRDVADTAAGLDRLHPGDGQAWMDLYRQWERIEEPLVASIMTPFPPVRHAARAALRLPRVGGMSFVRTMLAPCRAVGDEHFGGEAPKLLLAGSAMHADIPMDAPGSGAMGMLLTMLGQHHGWPVPRGGARMLAAALVHRLESLGGRVRTGSRVAKIVVENGAATGVRIDGGEVVPVSRAVIADVSAPALYGGLLSREVLPRRLLERMRRFEWDPGTVKVDWALDGPVPWASAPAANPGTVQFADSVGELAIAGAQITSGIVPADPFLLFGQMAASDPTRAPAGSESVWAYTHVPHMVREDAGGGIRGVWDDADVQRMADRMQARVERYAPGFGDRVLARRILGPRQMQERDENLVGGALNGGTASLQQELVFRPVAGLGRPETPVRGVYLGSASAHPGGGVHGSCGANAASAALAHHRVRSLLPGSRSMWRSR